MEQTVFDPKTHDYPFPEITDQHYMLVRKNDGTVFDKDYKYVDESGAAKFRQALMRVFFNVLVVPLTYLKLGLRVRGRKNLRKHREEIKNGIVSCSNHVHKWDFFMILTAVNHYKPYVLIWAKNIAGEYGKFMRALRGIPVPDTGVSATMAQIGAIEKILNKGEWLHVYSEGSMWEYYCPIRPFKRGAAYFARACGKPVLPLAFSYREPGWIRKKIFKQTALFTLNIGEPIYADASLSGREQEEDLLKRSHDEVCRLAGIDPEKNVYPPIFANSHRVDYY